MKRMILWKDVIHACVPVSSARNWCNGNPVAITFASKQTHMTVREWIRKREIGGMPTLTFGEVRQAFPNASEQVVKNELFRLSAQKIIVSVYRGFYVIMPPHYAGRGVIPPHYYIDRLMAHQNKPYYISLLSAAALLGAAHQRPQKFFVTTVLPKPSVSPSKNNLLVWSYRKEIPSDFLLTKNSETGTIRYSNAELTAIDLIQYEQYIGGLSEAATILAELSEGLDFRRVSRRLFDYTSQATLQRLGYVLEEVLLQTEVADVLYEKLRAYAGRLRYVPLSTRSTEAMAAKNDRWKIDVNMTIEPDDV